MRLWGGRFAEANDPLVADFTRSIEIASWPTTTWRARSRTFAG